MDGTTVGLVKEILEKKELEAYSKASISRMMGIHPKSIYKPKKVIQMRHYKKASDKEVLESIRPIIKDRPTYGYKRVAAMVSKATGKKHNKKKIYRVMKINGLLLPKAATSRSSAKTGKVMTLHSNTRWCSDAFEIKCFNGEKVFVVFSLDTCDREIISYVQSPNPLTSDDIESLMIMSIESRFNSLKAPRSIQFLSDRGSIYRSPREIHLARRLGLESCFTSAYSPESNGMAEALVKTLKRDYVYNHDCYSAADVMKMLPGWIKDYNEKAPHSAPRMLSPSEFRASINYR